MSNDDESASGAIARYAEGFRRIDEHMRKELREFHDADADRKFILAARQLMDKLWNAVDYLCNCESVVYNSGEAGDVSDVIEKIKDRMSESYASIFGEEYMNRMSREKFGEPRRIFHGPDRGKP